MRSFHMLHCTLQNTSTVDEKLLMSYLEHARSLRPQNLGHFIESYIQYLSAFLLGVLTECLADACLAFLSLLHFELVLIVAFVQQTKSCDN